MNSTKTNRIVFLRKSIIEADGLLVTLHQRVMKQIIKRKNRRGIKEPAEPGQEGEVCCR